MEITTQISRLNSTLRLASDTETFSKKNNGVPMYGIDETFTPLFQLPLSSILKIKCWSPFKNEWLKG